MRPKCNDTISSLVKPIVWMLWQRRWVFWRIENKVRDSALDAVFQVCADSLYPLIISLYYRFRLFSPNINGFSIRRMSWIMVLVQRQDKRPRCSAIELRALINSWFQLSSPELTEQVFGARTPEHWLRTWLWCRAISIGRERLEKELSSTLSERYFCFKCIFEGTFVNL